RAHTETRYDDAGADDDPAVENLHRTSQGRMTNNIQGAAFSLRLLIGTLARRGAYPQLQGMNLSSADSEALAAAVRRLESPSLAGRLAALAGKPVGFVQRALPAAASAAVAKVAKHALERALYVALYSLRNRRFTGGRKLHSGLACTSGAIGGA